MFKAIGIVLLISFGVVVGLVVAALVVIIILGQLYAIATWGKK
jgi:hypothetical protein